MTRKAPAFQLYVDDFLAGTIEMTAEEVGVYIRLLCIQWSKGVVTERAAKSTCGSSEAINYVLSTKFESSSDGFRNRRLEEVRRLSEIRAEAASKGGSKTVANRQANDEQNVSKQPSKTGSKTQPSHSHSHSHSLSSSDSISINVVERWTAPDKEFVGRVFDAANKISKACKTLDKTLIWRACWIGESLDVEALDECITSLKSPGVVNSPKGFLASAMIRVCERNGYEWDDLKKKVPPLSKFCAPVQSVAPKEMANV